jgi:hypothetical protein
MSGTAMAVLKLVVVLGLSEADATDIAVSLHAGQKPILHRSTTDNQYYLGLLQKSIERHRPVGVAIRDNIIDRVVSADQDTVREIFYPASPRINVWFMGHEGTYDLDVAQPEANRIQEVLRSSHEKRLPVWFVAKIPDLSIEDVVLSNQMPSR